MAEAVAPTLFQVVEQKVVEQDEDFATLDKRYTDELVIAFVGPVGSGVTTTAALLKEIFERVFSYTTTYIRVSELIQESAPVVGERYTVGLAGEQRIERLQTIGTKLREQISEAFLAEKCVEKIAIDRRERGGYEQHGDTLVPVPRRHVHIIDSLKNPAEVKLLREVYGETFWLFGVFAPPEVREARLTAQGLNPVKLKLLLSTDEEEGVEHGQKVRDTIEQADFFVRNDRENDDRLKVVLNRYLSILFSLGVQTPTQDEMAMYTAASAATSSACLSRQVGAAIYTNAGELIGKGSNDVPRRGGGLYTVEAGDDDHRCYKWAGHICHNDAHKSKLYQDIYTSLKDNKVLRAAAGAEAVMKALRQTDIRGLIEFSRANHAEMEAILSVARGHKAGIVGATLYCTTFPCHACARLIVGSGIARVIYIEPYPKSLALTLHKDAISVNEDKRESHVLFLQYEGVAPKNVVRLFKQHGKRKQDGKAVTRRPETSSPICRTQLDGFPVREQIVLKRVGQIEAKAKAAPTTVREKSNGT
ncbi:anti-phage dCTP deaminase [Azospirillum sp. 11R-A]|uniref:anti-phage dCTP deaminase n=1 Tax=Azospirillum sp. 11R-A TaxID=3111634 RepID=UPI003C28E506